ncbi:SDR family oxidoreductase [Arenicella chitinivorans]|uniref:SDR family oxidoreductase n=1 Tax=Arenicella chitinivorans TaxID=1329800 RepID=A0A918RLZ6_9GAMM|nr:SDR family NAD(P)-dependent oxidoreductase [Arenicella chitinivorans]GHA02492.1 SDR family oxidoreductase [Arenicella chitinivorans]
MQTRSLVIGANGTIGRALCDVMAPETELHQLSRDNCDYSSSHLQMHAARLAKIGEFDRIICCIGALHNDRIQPEKKLADLDPNVLAEYFAVNTILPAMTLRWFSSLLRKQAASHFLVLSAMVGSIEDNKLGGWYGYRSAKAALNQVVRTAAIELRRIKPKTCVVAVHPGTTRGELTAPYARNIKPGKYYTPSESARRMLALTDRLTAQDSGGFFNWDGNPLPW